MCVFVAYSAIHNIYWYTVSLGRDMYSTSGTFHPLKNV